MNSAPVPLPPNPNAGVLGDRVQGKANLAIQCKECGFPWRCRPQDFVTRPLAAVSGMLESGIECPQCHHFYRAAFDTPALQAKRVAIRQARGNLRKSLLGAYEKEFNLIQKNVARRLARLEKEAKEKNESATQPAAG